MRRAGVSGFLQVVKIVVFILRGDTRMDELNESGTPIALGQCRDRRDLTPLKRALLAIEKLQAQNDAWGNSRAGAHYAIIGLGCRFPGAADPGPLDPARDGVDAVRALDRWGCGCYLDLTPGTSGKMVTLGRFLDAVVSTPAFGISPREAARMDSQRACSSRSPGPEHGLALERLAQPHRRVHRHQPQRLYAQ